MTEPERIAELRRQLDEANALLQAAWEVLNNMGNAQVVWAAINAHLNPKAAAARPDLVE